MNTRQRRLIRGAESGIAFVVQLKKPSPRITEASRRLKEAVDSVRAAALDQLLAKEARTGPRRSVTRAKTVLLRQHLDPIAADGLEMFVGVPGVKETLKLPRLKDAPEKHLEAAERVRRVAEEHEEEFINARNYDENFLESFDIAVQNLEAAAKVKRGLARANYTNATEDVKNEIARVRRAFNVLDTRIREAYLDDRSTLRRWRKSSRVPPKQGRPKKR
jgi:hypothetical protein